MFCANKWNQVYILLDYYLFLNTDISKIGYTRSCANLTMVFNQEEDNSLTAIHKIKDVELTAKTVFIFSFLSFSIQWSLIISQ